MRCKSTPAVGTCPSAALSFKNSKIVEIHHHIIFISDSCRFHATFMALSCHFQPNRAPCKFMSFSWQIHGRFMALFLKSISKLSSLVISCLCLSICRQCFFSSFDIFSLMVFQVDQSFCAYLLLRTKLYRQN